MTIETTVPTKHKKLLAWVEEVAELTGASAVHWCDGSAEEYDALCQELVDAGTFEKLSDAKRPNSYLARSDPGDITRVTAGQIRVRALGVGEPLERAGVHQLLAQRVVLLRGAVAPVDR